MFIQPKTHFKLTATVNQIILWVRVWMIQFETSSVHQWHHNKMPLRRHQAGITTFSYFVYRLDDQRAEDHTLRHPLEDDGLCWDPKEFNVNRGIIVFGLLNMLIMPLFLSCLAKPDIHTLVFSFEQCLFFSIRLFLMSSPYS